MVPVLRVSPAGALRISVPSKLYVPRLLAQQGLAGYEPDAIACFLAAIEISGAGSVFDVGANVGVYAVVAAALTTTTVVAFEPTPDLVAAGLAICAENGLDCRFEQVALGETEGRAVLYLSDRTDSSNSLLSGFRPSTASLDVAVTTIDAFCSETGLAPRVIKIDTEATEPAVLRGGLRHISEHRPWIICEVLAGRTEGELTAILDSIEYRAYPITSSSPLQEATAIAGDPTYQHMNWLFAPVALDPPFQAALDRWRIALRECGAEALAPGD